MVETMREMPSLQKEDDGFLLQLKKSVLESHVETLGLTECKTLDDCIEKILSDSESSIDVGASLPLYIPWRDDDGTIQGSEAKPVWAGHHIETPLYGDLKPEAVESLITGKRLLTGRLYTGFMRYSPAFRVALLVHHIMQVVLIHPLAAEAFVLGRYKELPFEDTHYEEYGVPTTDLVSIKEGLGLSTEWIANSRDSLSGACLIRPRISRWTVQIRGSQPKESLMIGAWQEIRYRLDLPRETGFTRDGVQAVRPCPMSSGRSRKRTSNPDVDRLIAWINCALTSATFPMRGSTKDWKSAVIAFEKDNPDLTGRWTSETMRKAFERRRRRGR